MRTLVQPPPSSHCDLCGGELRLKRVEAANRTLDNRRVIASLSTVPDRISACIGHDAKCASAAMDCVVKQDPRSSETQQ